jgi:hypothetical protein
LEFREVDETITIGWISEKLKVMLENAWKWLRLVSNDGF